MTDRAPIDGVLGVVRLFERYPLVAIGELHGVAEGVAYLEALVGHPQLARAADAIVVEFGNAHHQAMLDAYLAGHDVAASELARICHDLVGAGPAGFRAPIYPRFFATVRAVNDRLPADRKLRVLLGDPPLDWARVRTPDDVHAAMADRDAHFARVVEREVVARGRRALLVAGGLHLLRSLPFPQAAAAHNLVQRLERDHRGQTYVILPHDVVALDARLAAWPAPALARLDDGWLGELPASAVFGGHDVQHVSADGVVTHPFAGWSAKLSTLADGYLYLGPAAAHTRSRFDPSTMDDADRAEVARRAALFAALP